MSQLHFDILDEEVVQKVIREHLKAQQAIYTKIALEQTQALNKKLSSKGILYDSDKHMISIQKLIDKTLLAQSDYIHDNFVDRKQIDCALKTCKKVKNEQITQANKIKELIDQIIQEIQAPLIEQYEQKIEKYVEEMQISDKIQSLPKIQILEVGQSSHLLQLMHKMNEYDLMYSENLLSYSQAPETFSLKQSTSGKNKKAS